MEKTSYEIGPLPVKYEMDDDTRILALGSYRGLGFAVISMYGKYPCAYVDVHGTDLDGTAYADAEIDVHGGLSYSERGIHGLEGGWWLGWDYAHAGDAYLMPALPDVVLRGGRKWKTSEIVSECRSVIDQVLENTKGKNRV